MSMSRIELAPLPSDRRPAAAEGEHTTSQARLWPVLLVVAVFFGASVGLRLAQHDILWFVHFSEEFLEASEAEATPPPSAATDRHYDGEYYWAVAVDPLGSHEYIPPEIAGYVYSRALYPLTAHAVSLGADGAIPWALLLLNLLAIGAGTAALGAWLRARGLSPWYALLFGLYPGLVFAVFHDLTEPLAYGLAALGIWAFDRGRTRRLVLAAALFALAVLARETTALFPLVAALALVWPASETEAGGWRRWRRGALFLAATLAPLFAWRAVLALTIDSTTQESWDGIVSLIPFYGAAKWWPWQGEHQLAVGAVVVPTLVALVGLAYLVRDRRARLYGLLLLLNAAFLVVFLPSPVFIDYRGSARAATGVLLAVVVCLPAWRRLAPRLYLPVVVTSWSFLWFLLVALAVDVPGYSLITS
jgi:hypothetical protein